MGSSVTPASVMIGIAIAPKATGAVLATSATAGGLDRLEAEREEHDGGDRHRRAEAGQRLDQGAEAESDDDRLDALVVGDAGERAAQDVEVAAFDGHAVDPDRVDDDPHDREQSEGRPLEAGVQGLAERHVVDHDGHQERHGQADQRGPLGRHANDADEHEEHEQRQRREDGGQAERVADRIEDLGVHGD